LALNEVEQAFVEALEAAATRLEGVVGQQRLADDECEQLAQLDHD
jgi:hypothetical protein